jgi:hypothetical protein
MKQPYSLKLLLCLAIFLVAAKASYAQSEARRSPVVVELFTSEGCSTCPPAEALLLKLEKEQSIGGAEVVALELHVDYWNQQGWMDPFSSVDWTARQQVYVAAFKQDGEYTPQMVVDGRIQFVGNRLNDAAKAIAAAAREAKTKIDIIEEKSEKKDQLRFHVEAGKLEGSTSGDTAEIWLAVTERGLYSAVERGENAGRELHHAAVARQLRKIGTADARENPAFLTSVELKLKPAWILKNLVVVVMIQEKKTRRILGASALPLTQ